MIDPRYDLCQWPGCKAKLNLDLEEDCYTTLGAGPYCEHHWALMEARDNDLKDWDSEEDAK